ncbi:aspartyl/asparaginyl beta-hydroxylase domain-containing protein [Kitasatospora mediocidica]|uniref:aspartyl/asparaginyl beta-hydroxylase domain-containing protein n=1 Tax=Kitasatospora mediocidica TaxID=58352 RepID=UPI0005697BC4|nr:aspartyl/asparaginyl beta-hydroxylase domain-containing protein [Kitasatospora mediocidica]
MTITEALTVPMPAEAARLAGTFDVARLLAELEVVRSHRWDLQRVYGDAVGDSAEVDWRVLSLRSQGGDGTRTDPGGPGLEDFADTEWLAHIPYTRSILAALPAPLRAVRFMALGPGAVGVRHRDPMVGPTWGRARLHIPLTTNPGAVVELDGVEHRWQPGEFWFGDFNRMHSVWNSGSEPRVHMVIDCHLVPELAEVFPADWSAYFEHGDVLFHRPENPLQAAELAALPAAFDLPAAFVDWERTGDPFAGAEQPQATVTVELVGDALELQVAGGRRLRLVHVADREFRFAGWTQERTVQLLTDRPQPAVLLRSRAGRTVRELTVPARPTA